MGSELGVEAHSCKGALLAEPWDIRTATDGNYQVFTPYHRAFLDRIDPAPPQAAPNELSAAKRWPHSLELDALGLRPRIAWDAGLKQTWTPGEAGAHARLRALPPRLPGYRDARDLPAEPGTSRLSPHLHFGEVSPAQVWHAVGGAEQKRGLGRNEWRHGKFLGELIWRDAPEDMRAWQQGRTGVDIVDAGMRELWETGWMHNRVRMICASFLVKNLLVPWQHGARWFWDTLVDADLANNSLNWQWIAGSGPDAAPWFRVFNPLLQAKRFDPDGIYQRRWARQEEPLLAPFAAEKSRAAALEAYRALKTQDE